jgi:hypothetical protein
MHRKRSSTKKADDNPFATSPSSGHSRSSSLSLSACYNCCQKRLEKVPKIQDNEAEFDMNISFSGGYVPNTDLIRVDKGLGNPQFMGLVIQ